MLEQILNQFNLYIWAKDKNYRYIFVNENYAKAAGMDSPQQMIGKTDDEMPWRDMADDLRRGDYDVLNGMSRTNSHEKTTTVTGVTDILVCETRLLDGKGYPYAVSGSFFDITGKKLVEKPGYYDAATDRHYFCIFELGDIYLTGREMKVFKFVMKGWPAARIASVLGLSPKTVETYLMYIRRKFCVSNKAELMTLATKYGLMHVFD